MKATWDCPPAPVLPKRRKTKNNAVIPPPTTTVPTARTINSAF